MKTVFVADDKSNICNLVRDYLEVESFRVVIAANGREALYIARAEKPDLILLDSLIVIGLVAALIQGRISSEFN